VVNGGASVPLPQAAAVWELLESVKDPEIPVVSIRELGILRSVTRQDDAFEVVLTYSGCPAMEQIRDDVRAVLADAGLPAQVLTCLSPAWTTDWMTPEARDKLREYGIAPPGRCVAEPSPGPQPLRFAQPLARRPPEAPVCCPRCGSSDTTLSAYFGSTACKALYRCLACLEPFDYFKPY
jgi:ring-1,2-phenylacetyl-CoA epoxidase subunit PaaD